MYNNSQYFRHSSDIICHAGKKGMKWGQGPFSKLKGYVKKTQDNVSKFVDEKITGESAKNEAQRRTYDIEHEEFIGGDSKMFRNAAVKWRKEKQDRPNAYYAEKAAREVQGYDNKIHGLKAKRASANRKYNKSLFGRARLIFGNPKKKRG